MQALRSIKKFHNRPLFKERLKSAAERFEKSHEIEGIRQCITAAKWHLLRTKSREKAGSDDQQIDSRQQAKHMAQLYSDSQASDSSIAGSKKSPDARRKSF